MRILDLAKELGVSPERMMQWAQRAGLPYKRAEDEVDAEHEGRIRQAFSQAHTRRRADERGRLSDDQLLDAELGQGLLDLNGDIPETLEEFEALEREILKSPPEMKAQKTKPARVPTSRILEQYGISGKSVLKRLRKLLPGNVARLLNQQDLSDSQHATLTGEIESRAVFYCDHAYCRDALERRHSAETLIPVKDSSHCFLCRGSAIRRSLEEAAEACVAAGVRRILVVGGMPASHTEIRDNTPLGVEFRLVEGDTERQRKRVQADLRWCDLAVIWGSTILTHSLSGGYTRRKSSGGPFILHISRRSVEALCSEVIKHVRRD
jgi:hypothetical protein